MKKNGGRTKKSNMTIEDLAAIMAGRFESQNAKIELLTQQMKEGFGRQDLKIDTFASVFDAKIENLAILTSNAFEAQNNTIENMDISIQELRKDIEILGREVSQNFNKTEMQFEIVKSEISSLKKLGSLYVTRPELDQYIVKMKRK